MFIVCLFLLTQNLSNPTVMIKKIEKAAKGKPEILLVMEKPAYGNYYDGIEIFNAPGGKKIVEAPKSLMVYELNEYKKDWAKIAVLSPYVLTGWVKKSNLGKIIVTNTYFYSKPSKSAIGGYLSSGVIVREGKKSGDFTEVTVNHYVPIRVWVETKDIGLKFGSYKYVRYNYYSRWQRVIFDVKKGPIYTNSDKKEVLATLTADARFKVERRDGKMVLIASPSDYDMKFKGWVEAARVDKKSHTYYSYQYSFRSGTPVTAGWFGGQFKLSVDKTVFADSGKSIPLLYIKKGTGLLHFRKENSTVFEVVFGRGYYYNSNSTLSSLLDFFENPSSHPHYISNYDKTWKIKGYTTLTMEDLSPGN